MLSWEPRGGSDLPRREVQCSQGLDVSIKSRGMEIELAEAEYLHRWRSERAENKDYSL